MNGQRRPSSPRSSTSSRTPRKISAEHISDEISDEIKKAIKSTTAGIPGSLVQIVRFLPKGELQTILSLQILRSYLKELFGDILEEGTLPGGGHEPTGLDERIDNALTLVTGDTARGIPPRRALLALFLYQRRTGLLAVLKSWLLSQRNDFPSDNDLPFSQQSLKEAGIPDRYHDYFNDYQSIFTPVVLRKGQNQIFTSKDRLPYIGAHLTKQEGSSGIVYTRKVAPCHWEVQLPNGSFIPAETVSPTILALKVFNGGRSGQEARADFEIERKILEDLRNNNFAHKMILLSWGSITIQDEQGPPIAHSLIFECATYSLEEFLMGEKGVETSWTASLLLARLADIVQALACLHDNFDTLHLNIKPDNILVFEKASKDDPNFEWKISDFGLARKRTAEPRAGHLLDLGRSTSRSASLLATRGAGRYQAPEIQQRNASKAGQKSDVWSMGCVALMVLGFAINGSKSVTGLTNALEIEYYNGTGFDHLFYVTNESFEWELVGSEHYSYRYSKEYKTSTGAVPGMRQLEAAVHPRVIGWSNTLYRYCNDKPEQPMLKSLLEIILLRVLLIDMGARIKAGSFYKYLIEVKEDWKRMEESPEGGIEAEGTTNQPVSMTVPRQRKIVENAAGDSQRHSVVPAHVNGSPQQHLPEQRNFNKNENDPSIGILARHPEDHPLVHRVPQQPVSRIEKTTRDPTKGDTTAGLDIAPGQQVQVPSLPSIDTGPSYRQSRDTGSQQPQSEGIPRPRFEGTLCSAIKTNDATTVGIELERDIKQLERPCIDHNIYPIHWALLNNAYSALEVLLAKSTVDITGIVCKGLTVLELALTGSGDCKALECIRLHKPQFQFPPEVYHKHKNQLSWQARKLLDDLYETKVWQSRWRSSRLGKFSRDVRDTTLQRVRFDSSKVALKTSSPLAKQYQGLPTKATLIDKPTERSYQDDMNVRSIASSMSGRSNVKRGKSPLPLLQEQQMHGGNSSKTTPKTKRDDDLSSEAKSTTDLSCPNIEHKASTVIKLDPALATQYPENHPTDKPDYERNIKTSTTHNISADTQGRHCDDVSLAALKHGFAGVTKLRLQVPEVDATSPAPPTDSGYASQRHEDALQNRETLSPNFELASKFEKVTGSQIPSSCDIEVDSEDVRSVESDRESIGSKLPTSRSNAELFAIKYLATFFAQLNDLRPLHEAALHKIERHRFIQNYRRVLKSYYRRLFHEAVNNAEKEVLKVLRSRQNRESIAEGIARHFEPTDEDDAKSLEGLMAAQPAVVQYLETWLGESQDMSGGQPHKIDQQYDLNEDCIADDLISRRSDSGSEVDVDSREAEAGKFSLSFDDHVNMNSAERFLQQGSAFRKLVLDLRLLIMPGQVREIFETTPKASIRVLSKTDQGWINKAKAALEIYTGLEWDWWPLAPPTPEINLGEHQLQWKLCGRTLYTKIRQDHAHDVSEALKIADDHPSKCHCCVPKPQKLSNEIFGSIWPTFLAPLQSDRQRSFTSGASTSRAAAAYTPAPSSVSIASSSTITPALGGATTPNATSINIGTQSSTSTHRSSVNGSSTISQTAPTRIVFGVQGVRRSLEIEQIEISDQMNDQTFFSELKIRHKKHRSSFRNLLSPFRFRHCNFVKFQKLDANRVFSCGEDLPDPHGFAHDYDYFPRHPIAKMPLIEPSLFAAYLASCDKNCMWSVLGPRLHDCFQLPPLLSGLECIPKKKSDFAVEVRPQQVSLQQDSNAMAWGIKADYAVSFLFLSIYHLLPLLSGFGFWMYWLASHPGDLQNASVPTLTTIALMAGFWGLFGSDRNSR